MNVYINAQAKFKLWSIIDALDKEVGGFGYATLEDEDIVLEDVFLVHQTSSKSEVDFTGGGIAEAIEKAVTDNQLSREGFVWFSWHSHHSMGAYWSQTDEECIKTYGTAGIPMLLSLVGNHKHEYKCRFDMFGVKHHNLDVGQVTMDELKIYDDLQDPILRELRDEINLKVKDTPKAAPKQITSSSKHQPTNYGIKKDEEQKKKDKYFRDKDDLDVPLGLTIEEAFEIRELQQMGLSYMQAKELVENGENGFEIGPAEVEAGYQGFDTDAYLGVGATDPA